MYAYITASQHFEYQKVRFAFDKPTKSGTIAVSTEETVTEEIEDFGTTCFAVRLAAWVREKMNCTRYRYTLHRNDLYIYRQSNGAGE